MINLKFVIKQEKISELVLTEERVLNILVIPQTGTQGSDRGIGP